MTEAAKVLLTKYAITFLLGAATFILLDGNPWGWVLAVSITVATFNYLVGDYFVLERVGNIAASLTNGLLSAIGAYVVSFLFPSFEARLSTILAFGALVVVGEYLIHKYLMQSEEVRPS